MASSRQLDFDDLVSGLPKSLQVMLRQDCKREIERASGMSWEDFFRTYSEWEEHVSGITESADFPAIAEIMHVTYHGCVFGDYKYIDNDKACNYMCAKCNDATLWDGRFKAVGKKEFRCENCGIQTGRFRRMSNITLLGEDIKSLLFSQYIEYYSVASKENIQ